MVAGIVGSLAAGCGYCLVVADDDFSTAEARIGLLIGIATWFFMGFLLPYEAAGRLLFSPEERRLHASEVSAGRLGTEAFVALLLFGGHFGLLAHAGYASVKEWLLAAVFLVVFVRAARAYLQSITGLSQRAPGAGAGPAQAGLPAAGDPGGRDER
jgi:hypothetical protein